MFLQSRFYVFRKNSGTMQSQKTKAKHIHPVGNSIKPNSYRKTHILFARHIALHDKTKFRCYSKLQRKVPAASLQLELNIVFNRIYILFSFCPTFQYLCITNINN